MSYPVAAARGGHAPSAAPSSLLAGLVAYWPLDEAAGSRADLGRNGYTLTPGATDPNRNTGRVYDYAAEFASAVETDILQSTAIPLRKLQTGSFSIAAWVYPYSFSVLSPAYNYLVTCWEHGGVQGLGWMLFMSNHQCVMFMSAGDGSATVVTHGGNVAEANGWHLFSGWFDATPGAMRVCSAIDLAGTDIQPYPYAPYGGVNNRPFTVGHRPDLWEGRSWDGRVGPLMIWDRLLIDAEWRAVYNGGAGLVYPMAVGE